MKFELTPPTELDLFLDRIAKITNIFEHTNWTKKHMNEINELQPDVRQRVLHALSEKRVELVDMHEKQGHTWRENATKP